MNRIRLTGHVAGPPSRAPLNAPIPPPTALLLAVARDGTDATDWIGVTVIGPAADTAADLPVGTPIAVDGYLHSTTAASGRGHRLEVVGTGLRDLTDTPPDEPTDTWEAQP